MQGYSPFDKPIQKLQASDLTVLRDVHEGWYVEYKSDLIESKKLAKAISAFANTYGGWLFFGVQECSSDDGYKAGSFPGISKNNLNIVLQRLRQSTSEYLNPVPYFEHKILEGPCNNIELREDTVIIVIEIPESHAAPHIHKDGRIYRRVADSSEPKHETDRFILDQLWNRGETVRKKIREWILRDPQFSKGETEIPYARLLLSIDPWQRKKSPLYSSLFPKIRNIIKNHQAIGISFDTLYSTGSGFIARQTKGMDPHTYGVTWRMCWDLSCEIIVPLPKYSKSNNELLSIFSNDNSFENFSKYRNFEEFIKILQEKNYTNPRIVDLNYLMCFLLAAISQYRQIMNLVEVEEDLYFKIRFLNTWRFLPFVNSREILKGYKEYGLPIILDNTLMYPSGDGPESFRLIESFQERISEEIRGWPSGIIRPATEIFIQLSEVLGIYVPREKPSESLDEWIHTSLNLVNYNFKDHKGNDLK